MTFIPASSVLNNVDSKDDQPATIELTNAGDGTTTIVWDARTFRAGGLQFVTSGGSGTATLTIEGSMEDVASGSADFDDVTSLLTGTASYTASTMLQWGDQWAIFRWLQIKVVIAGASADKNVDVFPYRGY